MEYYALKLACWLFKRYGYELRRFDYHNRAEYEFIQEKPYIQPEFTEREKAILAEIEARRLDKLAKRDAHLVKERERLKAEQEEYEKSELAKFWKEREINLFADNIDVMVTRQLGNDYVSAKIQPDPLKPDHSTAVPR